MRRTRRFRTTVTLATAALAIGGSLFGLASPAFAGGGFTAGDLVVEVVGNAGGYNGVPGAAPSSTSAQVSLVDYSTSGTPSGSSVTFPSTTSTDTSTSHALVDSGTATYNGEISLSADGGYIYVAGYDANTQVASLTSTTGVARTVGIVSATGTVDTLTALTGTALTASGINFRTATGTTGGTVPFYSGGDNGLQISSDGATTATSLNSDVVHQVEIANGQLYESIYPKHGTGANIVQVGSNVPTTGSPSDTSILASPPTGFEPAGFAFATLGSATSANTLYVADTGNGEIEKYSYNGATWAETGAVAVTGVTGIAVSVNGGTAQIYATNQSGLYGLTDSSGAGGTFTSTVNTLVAAPTGESFKGLVFAPVTPNNGATPETPYALLLPGLAAVGLAGYFVLRRRPRTA